MTLSEYIKKHGDEVCAQAWNMRPRTVAAYRRGEIYPSPDVARRIVDNTNGEVDFAGIYGREAA